MVRISIDSLKGFEEVYFEKIYEVINGLQFVDDIFKTNTYRMVWETYDAGYYDQLLTGRWSGLKPLLSDSPDMFAIEKISEEDIKYLVKALVLAGPDVIHSIGNKYDAGSIPNPTVFAERFKRAYSNMRNKKIDDPLRAGGKISVPGCIIELTGVRICPYCGRNYIGFRRKNKEDFSGVQFDHFLPKDSFPLFSVSLYNLIPCCGSCNLAKREKHNRELISPYEDDSSFDKAVRISYDLEVKTMRSRKKTGKKYISDSVGICPVDPDSEKGKRYQSNIDMFELESIYRFHKPEARDYFERMAAYPPSLLEEIVKTLGKGKARGKKVTVDDLETALFKWQFYSPGGNHKKPLIKFYRDIYNQYRR